MNNQIQKPTAAFVMAAWAALFLGSLSFVIGLWNAEMQLSEKGFFATVILYGLFSAVSLQKTVRDKLDGIPVTGIYFNLCWASLGISIFLLGFGLWFATLLPSEKGFYAMAFLLSLFGAISVQKNIRDIAMLNDVVNEQT